MITNIIIMYVSNPSYIFGIMNAILYVNVIYMRELIFLSI
jgi:hypothetical protein